VGQFGIGQFNGAFGPNGQPIQQQTTNVENVTTDIIIQATQKATTPIRRVTTHSPPPSPSPSPPPPPPPPPPPIIYGKGSTTDKNSKEELHEFQTNTLDGDERGYYYTSGQLFGP
jgi:hypothetical protein